LITLCHRKAVVSSGVKWSWTNHLCHEQRLFPIYLWEIRASSPRQDMSFAILCLHLVHVRTAALGEEISRSTDHWINPDFSLSLTTLWVPHPLRPAGLCGVSMCKWVQKGGSTANSVRLFLRARSHLLHETFCLAKSLPNGTAWNKITRSAFYTVIGLLLYLTRGKMRD